MNIREYWNDILLQDRDAIRCYFDEDAYINWHCTNEHFTVDEFITANCEYPGTWKGNIERIDVVGDQIITVTHVYSHNEDLSFHAVSFFRVKNEKIISLDEYWGNDDTAPQWRLDKNIGKPIR